MQISGNKGDPSSSVPSTSYDKKTAPRCGPNDGQKVAQVLCTKGHNKDTEIADLIIKNMLPSTVDFKDKAGALRFFLPSQLTALKDKIGSCKTAQNTDEIVEIFDTAIRSTDDKNTQTSLLAVKQAFVATKIAEPISYPQVPKLETTKQKQAEIMNEVTENILDPKEVQEFVQKMLHIKLTPGKNFKELITENGEAIQKALMYSPFIKNLESLQKSHKPDTLAHGAIQYVKENLAECAKTLLWSKTPEDSIKAGEKILYFLSEAAVVQESSSNKGPELVEAKRAFMLLKLRDVQDKYNAFLEKKGGEVPETLDKDLEALTQQLGKLKIFDAKPDVMPVTPFAIEEFHSITTKQLETRTTNLGKLLADKMPKEMLGPLLKELERDLAEIRQLEASKKST